MKCSKIKRMGLPALAFIALLSVISSASVQHVMSIQGKAINRTSGALLTAGNVSVSIFDASTGGNLIFNDTFNNTISNGTFNVLLGSQMQLNLTYNKMYFMELAINREIVIGSTNRRQFFATGGPNQTYLAVSEDSGGNVGIGTLSPAARLEVVGSAGVLALNVNNSLYVNTTTSYVGIGTTAPAYPVDINGNTRITGSLGINNVPASVKLDILGVDGTTSYITTRYSAGTSGYGTLTHFTDGFTYNFAAGTVPTSGDFAFISGRYPGAAGTERMRITQDGNVGIGTASPNEKLHIIGNIFVNATGDANSTHQFNSSDIILSTTGWNNSATWYGLNVTLRNAVSKGNLTNRLAVIVNGSERVSVDSQGNVGIGTITPAHNLEVTQAAGTGSSAAKINGNGSATWAAFNVQQNGLSAYGLLVNIKSVNSTEYISDFRANNTSKMIIQGNGNVGIGTTSPNATLNVRGGVNVTGSVNLATMEGNVGIGTTSPNYIGFASGVGSLTIKGTGVNEGVIELINSNASDAATIGQINFANLNGTSSTVVSRSFITSLREGIADASNIAFYTQPTGGSSTERVRITSAGNVGIGTTSPNATLQVMGAANVLALNVNNTLYVNTTGSRVGIGTTIPTHRLQINGTNTNGTENILFVQNGNPAYRNGGVKLGVTANEGDITVQDSPGRSVIYLSAYYDSYIRNIQQGTKLGIGTTLPNATLNVNGGVNVTGSVNLATLEGNVGIGTTSPNATLNVRGGANITGSVNLATMEGKVGIGTTAPTRKLVVYDLDANVATISLKTDGSGLTTTDGLDLQFGNNNSYLFNKENGLLQFGANNTATITISAGNNVGIGTTNPNATLNVRGGVNVTGSVNLATLEGNVGIGTTSPTQLLHLESSASIGPVLVLNNTNAGTDSARMYIYKSSASPAANDQLFQQVIYGMDSAGNRDVLYQLVVQSNDVTSGTEDSAVLIRTMAAGTDSVETLALVSGNVGIGTTTPSAKLHVNGTMIVNGTARINGSLSSEAAYDTINDGLVLYLPFSDGTGTLVSDKSRYGRDGTTTGSPTWNATGRFGNALNFDGTSDYAEFGGWFNYQNFTIAFWANPRPQQLTSGGFGFADIMDNFHNGSVNWVIQQNSTNTNQYTWMHVNSAFTLQANAWQYVVLTKTQNGPANAYVNGVLVTTNASSGSITYEDQFLTIGRWGRGGGREWNGTLDEVRMYDRVLSADEIMELYGRGLGTQGIYVNVTTGNVGIGTTSPGTKLDILGASSSTMRIVSAAGTVPAYMDGQAFKGIYITTPSGSGDYPGIETVDTIGTHMVFAGNTVGTLSNHDLRILTNSNDRVRITADGNVGIGTTSPNATLQVMGTANVLALNVNNTLYVNTTTSNVGIGTTTPYAGLQVNKTGTVLETNGTTLLAISGGNVGIGTTSPNATLNVRGGVNVTGSVNLATLEGNVGIGTTSPGQLLQVSGSSSPRIQLVNTAITGNAEIDINQQGAADRTRSLMFSYGGTNTAIVSSTGTTTGNLQFETWNGSAWTTVMKLTDTGNVGIGTTGPSAKLDIIGNLTVNGTSTSSSSGITLRNQTGGLICIFAENTTFATKVGAC